MSSNSSGKKLEGFFTGKGFYIVLFLCAAVIGVSAWMMAAGDETMSKDIKESSSVSLENSRVETVIIPPVQEDTAPVLEVSEPVIDVIAPETSTNDAAETENAAAEKSEVWREGDVMEVAAPMYVWPVSGELERMHSADALAYDVTMRDWRTHEGVDIIAPLGETVMASHSGSVESIVQDDLYGTVLTIDHGDGSKAVYANLAETPAVNVGDWLDAGAVIGAIGTTALCEIGQTTHLHFEITVDGKNVNPLNYLPA